MLIPPELTALVEQLNQELNQIEQQITEGLNLVKLRLDRFPNNLILLQIFASFNNYMLFVENTRRRIEITIDNLPPNDTINEEIQEAGEDLAEQLGRVLEAKIVVNNLKNRLEN